MDSASLTIRRKGQELVLNVRKGLGFQAVSKRQDIPLEFDCRKADCGICMVRVCSGSENLTTPGIAEADFLKAMRADPDERLACQCRILGDVEVEVDYL